jgi:arabinosaccharide transport system substrate-binding protein
MLAVPSEEAAAFDGMSRQLGSNYFDQDGNVILDREENIRTLNRLKDFVYEYEIADVVTDYHEQNFYNAFNNEKYASIFMPQWYMIRFTDFMPDLEGKIRVRALPAWPNGEGTRSTMGGGTGTAVTQEASDVELAKEFLAYAKLTREAGVKIWTDLGFDPIVSDAYNDEAFQEEFPYFGNEKVMLTIQDLQSEIQPLYFSDLLTRLRDQLNEETLYEIFENGGDVEENIKEAAEKLRAEQ